MTTDSSRLCELALELIEVPSPTGDTADVAAVYAQHLVDAGMEVRVLREPFPNTPLVIGTLSGTRAGPRIVFNGHLDTVPIPHAPPRIEDGRVYGRGSADMKGALACVVETVRSHRGSVFPGEIVVVATGLHEAPGGRGEDLTYFLRQGTVTGDFIVVCELGSNALPVAHMGSATFEITVRREGVATHELFTDPGTPHPIRAAAQVVSELSRQTRAFEAIDHPWVGSESYFVGQVNGGDFYNRFPVQCRLVGTRRWAPGASFAEAQAGFEALLAGLSEETGCTMELDLQKVKDPYQIGESHPLVTALRGAYQDVTGLELPLCGSKVVADAAIWQDEAGLPAVYHGPDGSGAHSDVESVLIDELVRATEVYKRLLERLWGAAA